MKLIPKLLMLATVGLASYVATPSARAQSLGLWDFNSGNLNASPGATLGPLTYADAATTSGTAFGSTTSFGITNINGTNALIMRFPANTNSMGYRMPTPGPNNGGTVNQYTFIADVYYPTASSGKIRPLIQTEDGTHLGSQQFIVIDSSGGIGPLKIGNSGFTGPYVGQILPNTWYRIAITVVAGGTIRVYTNGVAVGSFPGGATEGFFALDPSNSALIFGDTSTNAALGYVNSVQLRDSALSAGQISALGSVSAEGIPAVIPPVPSFVASRDPDVAQTGVSQIPAISVVLDQGDTTINSGSIQLKLDNVVVPATVTPSAPTYTVTYQVPPRLDPLSVHTLAVSFTDSVAGAKTISWTFTVKDYQVVTLPAPFFFENFDSLTENPVPGVALPAGWTVTNKTCPQTPGFDLDDRSSDSYKDWILVNSSRLAGWGANRTVIPTIILNGVELTTLTTGNLLWAESDARDGDCNGQFADLFTAPISCVGRSNVFLAFNSIYMQNQDNMDFMEYSVDNGVSWLPVLYYFDIDPSQPSDLVLTNGVIDVTATFARVDENRNWSPDSNPTHATNYGSYISAPISSIKPSDIRGRFNDSETDGKRIEVVRLPQADGKANVRFRMNANGTSAWFWGIDNFGLYEINTPVITTQPISRTVGAGSGTNFTVVVSSPSALTYQWQHEGTNISNGGHFSGVTTATLTISNADTNDAGAYKVRVTNADGFVLSLPATLTVLTVPQITTQPLAAVVSEGSPFTLSGAGLGGIPLAYQWYRGTTPVGVNSTNFSVASAQASDAGNYTLVVSNNFGSVTSRVARVSVSSGSITNNLVAHLKFDGNATDSTGRGNNGTPVGAPTFTAPGKIGNALTLATTGGGQTVDYVTLGYPNDLKFGSSTDFSISFWTKYTDQTSDPVFISNSDWDSSGNIGWGIFMQGGGNFRVKVAGTPRGPKTDVSPSQVLRDGTWHNVVVTFQQGGVMNTMVDGVLVNSAAWVPTGSVDTDVADLGSTSDVGPHTINIGQDGAGDYSVGTSGMTNVLMDDLGIWRRALSPQEAAAIFAAGQAGQNLTQAAVATALGRITITTSGGNVNFSWPGGTGIRLQKTTSLVSPTWTDISSTLGNSTHSEAITGTPTFYRLSKP